MKAIKTLVLLLALGLSAYGQGVVVTANKLKGSDTAPSGTCGAQRIELTTAGVIWTCASGTWSSAGGGGTTINSTNGTVPYRTGATTFADSPLTVNAPAGTGIAITSAAAGSGVTIGVTSPGANENLYIDGKGTGQVFARNSSSGATFGVRNLSGSGYSGIEYYDNNNVIKVFTGYNNNNVGEYRVNNVDVSNGFIHFMINSTAGLRLNNNRTVALSSTDNTAQLVVESQSTTRPSLKLRALSGTSGTQAVLENYDASGSRNFYITAAGTILYNTDNAVDIGASGANRPRSGYFGTQLNVGTGTVIGSNIQLANGAAFYWSTHGTIRSSADGVFKLSDNAETSFSRLQFGGTTSSFPSLKRSSAALETKLADDSAYAEHRALSFSVNNACVIRSGSGTPESAVTGNVCDLYLRTDGGANTTLYIKESGAATNTGWIAK